MQCTRDIFFVCFATKIPGFVLFLLDKLGDNCVQPHLCAHRVIHPSPSPSLLQQLHPSTRQQQSQFSQNEMIHLTHRRPRRIWWLAFGKRRRLKCTEVRCYSSDGRRWRDVDRSLCSGAWTRLPNWTKLLRYGLLIHERIGSLRMVRLAGIDTFGTML